MLARRKGDLDCDITDNSRHSDVDASARRISKKKIADRRRRFMGEAEEIAADIREYGASGVNTMIFDVRRPSSAETLERMEWMAKEVIAKI